MYTTIDQYTHTHAPAYNQNHPLPVTIIPLDPTITFPKAIPIKMCSVFQLQIATVYRTENSNGSNNKNLPSPTMTMTKWRQTKFIFALLIITVFHISFDVSTKYKYQTAKVAVAWNINRNKRKISLEFRLFCYCGHNFLFPIKFIVWLFAPCFHFISRFCSVFLSLHLFTVCVSFLSFFFRYSKQYCIILYLTN